MFPRSALLVLLLGFQRPCVKVVRWTNLQVKSRGTKPSRKKTVMSWSQPNTDWIHVYTRCPSRICHRICLVPLSRYSHIALSGVSPCFI